MTLTEDDHNAALKFISSKIKIILADELGKYQINGSSNEVAAVRVEPPKVPDNYKFKKDSGIEAIINRETEIDLGSMLGSNSICEKYQLKLTQYNLTKSLKIAILKLINSKFWEVYDKPIILPFAEIGEGYFYPQAIIKISVNYRQKFT